MVSGLTYHVDINNVFLVSYWIEILFFNPDTEKSKLLFQYKNDIKTQSGGITLKSTMAIKRSEKHGFNLHVGTHIFKKMNKTVDNNGTMETFETVEKVEPMTGKEVKLGIARHLFKTGVKIKDLIRMELIKDRFTISFLSCSLLS